MAFGPWAFSLLENAGIPLPARQILLLASFLAYSQNELQLPYIILVEYAATLGDNLGYALDIARAPPARSLPAHLPHRSRPLERGERLFRQYERSRFLRPLRRRPARHRRALAGVLRMQWKRFAVQFHGAVLWVSVISWWDTNSASHWDRLVAYIKDLILASRSSPWW